MLCTDCEHTYDMRLCIIIIINKSWTNANMHLSSEPHNALVSKCVRQLLSLPESSNNQSTCISRVFMCARIFYEYFIAFTICNRSLSLFFFMGKHVCLNYIDASLHLIDKVKELAAEFNDIFI